MFERKCHYAVCYSIDSRLINRRFVSYNDRPPHSHTSIIHTYKVHEMCITVTNYGVNVNKIRRVCVGCTYQQFFFYCQTE